MLFGFLWRRRRSLASRFPSWSLSHQEVIGVEFRGSGRIRSRLFSGSIPCRIVLRNQVLRPVSVWLRNRCRRSYCYLHNINPNFPCSVNHLAVQGKNRRSISQSTIKKIRIIGINVVIICQLKWMLKVNVKISDRYDIEHLQCFLSDSKIDTPPFEHGRKRICYFPSYWSRANKVVSFGCLYDPLFFRLIQDNGDQHWSVSWNIHDNSPLLRQLYNRKLSLSIEKEKKLMEHGRIETTSICFGISLIYIGKYSKIKFQIGDSTIK